MIPTARELIEDLRKLHKAGFIPTVYAEGMVVREDSWPYFAYILGVDQKSGLPTLWEYGGRRHEGWVAEFRPYLVLNHPGTEGALFRLLERLSVTLTVTTGMGRVQVYWETGSGISSARGINVMGSLGEGLAAALHEIAIGLETP